MSSKYFKKCTKCKIRKNYDDFGLDPRLKSGRKSWCKDCLKEYSRSYNLQNKEKISNYQSNWYKLNKSSVINYVKQYNKKYLKDKYHTDINYKISSLLRSRIRLALKNSYKSESTLNLLGCSIENLKIHLESQFTEGMNWDNHGYGDDKWHIDHILPCSQFDLSDETQQKLCFNYKNLQPLWQKDNLIKSDKIIVK